jgi:hypothetical protein
MRDNMKRILILGGGTAVLAVLEAAVLTKIHMFLPNSKEV